MPRTDPAPALRAAAPLQRWRSFLAAAICSALLAACATTQAPPDSGLNGQWRLDAAASDNVAMVVSAAVRKAQASLNRRRGAFGGVDTATDVFGSNIVLGPDFQELQAHLLETLSTSARLSLEVKSDDVEVQRDDLPPRDYQPGEKITRYDEYGTANLSSRWQGKAFELRERYTSGARLVETYEVDSAGALVYTRTMSDPTVGKLTVKSIYHRVSSL